MAPSPIRRKASTKCKVCGKKYPKAALKMQKRTIRAEPRAKALARKRRLRSKKMRSNFSPEALNKKVTTPRRRAVKKVTKAVKNRKVKPTHAGKPKRTNTKPRPKSARKPRKVSKPRA